MTMVMTKTETLIPTIGVHLHYSDYTLILLRTTVVSVLSHEYGCATLIAVVILLLLLVRKKIQGSGPSGLSRASRTRVQKLQEREDSISEMEAFRELR